MKQTKLNRRDFNRLTMAALGGVVAGTAIGCGGGDDSSAPAPSTGAGAEVPEAAGEEVAVNFLMEEPHVCRGLNTCKGKGAGGENACVGQGACYSAESKGRNVRACGRTPWRLTWTHSRTGASTDAHVEAVMSTSHHFLILFLMERMFDTHRHTRLWGCTGR